MLTFLTANLLEIACGSAFLGGFSIYSYFKLKGKVNTHKIQYCDVTPIIRQYKSLDKKMNESIGGANKHEPFFK